MVKIKIREPIWYNRSIGIADNKIVDDLEIEILYKDKDGFRVWPKLYKLSKFKAKLYPTTTRRGVLLRMIPIESLVPESLTTKPATLCRSESYFRKRRYELTSTIRTVELYIWAGSDMRLSEFAAKMKDELLAIEKEMLKRETQSA